MDSKDATHDRGRDFGMKSSIIYRLASTFALVALSVHAKAESVECNGRMPSPSRTTFVVSVDMDRGKSSIRFLLEDGTRYSQSLGFNKRKYQGAEAVVYSADGSDRVYLRLPLQGSGILTGSFTHAPQLLNDIPMTCELIGDIPRAPLCPAESRRDQVLLKAMDDAEKVEDIQFLLQCGANPNVTNAKGCTPLMLAVDPNCHPGSASGMITDTKSLVDLLLSNGAFANTQDKKGETALTKAVRNEVQGVYDLFIAAEADFDWKDKKGNTPLMYAAMTGDKWIILDVLEGNPDRRLKNKSGKTAYDLARHWHDQETASLVRIPDMTVQISGQNDGTCAPTSIEIMQNQAVEFVLRGTDQMFKLDARGLGLDLMADRGQSAKQIISPDRRGTYTFTCGVHGAAHSSSGTIVVK